MNIRELIFDCLNNAVENGYDMRSWMVENIISDLMNCVPELEDVRGCDIELHVREWLGNV